MKILSLFDGISCGMVSLERAVIPVERYVAYEIEESAIKISKKNYPQIEHCGDVFKADFTKYQEFDLLIGGSPCTYWSVARTNAGRETTSSGLGWDLFSQYVRALKESGCKYFLYENNFSMSQDIKQEITKALGVQPICINSDLVSAQNRKRLYWTNIPGVQPPEDKGILLENIIESGQVDRKKSLCIARRTVGNQGSQAYMRRRYFGKSFAQMVFENCTPQSQKDLWKTDPQKEFETEGYIRPLTIKEMERLQTLDDDYTKVDGISDIQRGEAIGNGWTVDVIAHILSYIPKQEREETEMELQIKPFSIPEVIEGNFEELKQEITRKASDYETLVYTDEQIPEAKKDRATLNKFVKVLDDERKRIKKECLKPYENVEPKFKELEGIVNRAITNIDGQVKGYEENKKQEKKTEIQDHFSKIAFPHWVTFEMIFNERWLNSSVSMKSVQTEIEEICTKIEADLATLENLPEFSFEAKEEYKRSLNLSMAIQEGQRLAEIQKRKREAEEEAARRKAEQEFAQHTNPPVEEPKAETPELLQKDFQIPKREWVSFQAYITEAEALQLKNFFDCRGIEFKPI